MGITYQHGILGLLILRIRHAHILSQMLIIRRQTSTSVRVTKAKHVELAQVTHNIISLSLSVSLSLYIYIYTHDVCMQLRTC